VLFTQDVLIQPCEIQPENSEKNMKAKGLKEKKVLISSAMNSFFQVGQNPFSVKNQSLILSFIASGSSQFPLL